MDFSDKIERFGVAAEETGAGLQRIVDAYRRGVKPPVPYSRFYFYNWETDVPTVVDEDIVGEMDARYRFSDSLYRVELGTDVSSIGHSAFERCSELKTVVLPDTIEKIDAYAFQVCDYLTSINLPDSIKEIGESAFHGDYRLTSIHVPKNLTEIKEYTFFGLESATGTFDIPPGVSSIGKYAFESCKSLSGELLIPASVEFIGEDAFAECEKMTSVRFVPDSNAIIDDSAFLYCTSLSSATFGGKTDLSRASFLFSKCDSIVSVLLMDGIENIHGSAFMGCPAEVIFKGKESIDVMQMPGFRWGIPQLKIICDDAIL